MKQTYANWQYSQFAFQEKEEETSICAYDYTACNFSHKTQTGAVLDLGSFMVRWHYFGTKMPTMRKVKSVYKYICTYVFWE
ncbi:hypothetical protein E2986_13504 [Frieseomelitta varia]|uniref:Uncharacterized protein n=1 Tax=Frieseomelitta varia TaxID=561572 RepID=A0A833SBK3_9HYME|nr:hypothetical protein E2986_13504 [Frieseomelitta varia]